MVPRLMLAAIAATLATAPTLARDIVVKGQGATFNDLEYSYSGSDRLDAARTELSREVPVGSDVAGARAILKQAGARCADVSVARLRCTSNHFEAVENVLHDVAWTISVDHSGNSVTGLSVERASIGS